MNHFLPACLSLKSCLYNEKQNSHGFIHIDEFKSSPHLYSARNVLVAAVPAKVTVHFSHSKQTARIIRSQRGPRPARRPSRSCTSMASSAAVSLCTCWRRPKEKLTSPASSSAWSSERCRAQVPPCRSVTALHLDQLCSCSSLHSRNTVLSYSQVRVPVKSWRNNMLPKLCWMFFRSKLEQCK